MTQETNPSNKAAKAAAPLSTLGMKLLKWLLVLLILGAGWLAWQQWQELKSGLMEARQNLEQLQRLQSEDRQQLGDAGKAMQQNLTSLQEQVLLHGQKLATLDEGGSRLWYLHEARSLASLAQQRLLLTADLSATKKLLEASDAVLAHLDEPSILPARRALAGDIERVQAAQQIDTNAVLLRLGALVDLTQTLSLPEDSEQAGSFTSVDDSESSSWWWGLLSRLPLSIRRSDDPLPLPLAPAQLAQVRLSLGMSLQEAQLAMLQGRPDVFRQALSQAENLLNSWFASGDPQVTSLLSALAELRKINVQQALPKIGAGFEAIDALLRPVPVTVPAGGKP